MSEGKKCLWLFYPLLSFLALFPCLVSGKSYFHDDLVLYNSPVRNFLAGQILQGRFPLWDPYLLGGMPFFADPNSMAAYPLLYPVLFFPTAWDLNLFFFFHLALAAWGMDFLLKAFSLPVEARAAGATIFALSGFFWNEIAHPPVIAAFAWFPWFFGFLERLGRSPRPFNAFGTGLSFALLFLSGNYQMSLTAFYGGLLFFALRQGMGERGQGKGGWARAGLCFFWGAFPLFLWMVPSLELILHSARFSGPRDYAAFNSDFSLVPSALWQFLFPRSPMGPVFLPPRETLDNAGYLGLFSPLLACLAFRNRPRRWMPFALLGLFGLALAFGKYLPFHHWACRWLPGFTYQRSPVRYLCLYTLAGAFLTALGYEALQGRLRSRGPVRAALARYALPLLLGAPLLWASWTTLLPGPASNFDVASRMPFLPSMKRELGPDRILIQQNRIPYETSAGPRRYLARFPVDAACQLHLRAANGYNPLWLREYAQITALPFRTFRRLMAVRGVLTGPGGFAEKGFSETDWPPFRFLRSRTATPLVWAVPRNEALADPEARLRAMARPSFNPYRIAYLSRPLEGNASAFTGPAALKWEQTGLNPDSEAFRVRLDRGSLLVFSEVLYPGWRAFVDGRPARIYTADQLLRCLPVPAGEHRILFCYRPAWVLPLAVLGALWLLSLAGARVFFRVEP